MSENRRIDAKPEDPLEVNLDHPLAKHLLVDIIGGNFVLRNAADESSPVIFSNNVLNTRMTSAGLGTVVSNGSTSDGVEYGTRQYVNDGEEFTVAVHAELDGYTVNQFPGLFNIASSSPAEALTLFVTDFFAAAGECIFGAENTSDWSTYSTPTGTIPSGRPFVIVIRYNGQGTGTANWSFILDGEEISLNEADRGVAATPNTNFFGKNNTTNNWDGPLLSKRFWDIRLTDAEAIDLSLRPYDPLGIPLERRIKRRAFFSPTGIISQAVAATATGVADRSITVFKTVSGTASGVAGVIAQRIGAVIEQAVTAVAQGAAGVQKTVFKTVSGVASGVAGVATAVISALTEVTVTAVAQGVPAIQRTIFKAVRATASGVAGAAASTGEVILQAVTAVAQGVAKRQVMILKTIKAVAPPPVVVNSEASFASAGGTFNVTMPEDRPDGSVYVFVIAASDGIFSTLTPPSELTEIDSRSQITSKIWVGYRVGDVEPTFYTFTGTANLFSGVFPTWHGLVIRLDGVDPDNIVDQTRNNAASNAITQAVTPAKDNTLVLSFNESPGGEYTSTPETKIYFGETDGLISLAAHWELGINGTSAGSSSFGHTQSGTGDFIGQMTSFPPVQGHVGARAVGIAGVIGQIFIKVNPFIGNAGLGIMNEFKTRWARRRPTWRRRR